MTPRNAIKRFLPPRFRARVIGVSWRDLTLSVLPFALILVGVIWIAMDLIFHPPGPGAERQLRGTLTERDED